MLISRWKIKKGRELREFCSDKADLAGKRDRIDEEMLVDDADFKGKKVKDNDVFFFRSMIFEVGFN